MSKIGTTKLKKKIQKYYLNIYFKIKKLNYKKGEKILLTSTDGIGDNIVREKLLKKFLEKYGNENIFIMCVDKTASLLKQIGFTNIIIYTREHRKRTREKIALIKKIAYLGIKEILSLEFDQHDIYIKYLNKIKRIGYENIFNEDMNSYYEEKIFQNNDYILNTVRAFYEYYFREKISLEKIKPNLTEYYKKNKEIENTISFGIGSADRKKMLSSTKIAEVIKIFYKNKKYNKIFLLGKGELEEKLIEELIKIIDLKEYNVENKINQLSLIETINIINNSKLYIGVDSGLYNYAFALEKEIIAFFTKKNLFSHDYFNNVKILYGKNKNLCVKNNYFGNDLLNSINVEEIL
ncbi:lipopolysaccharide heptosyltransferase family protein [Fusobacterium ulcerans]|uniref:glycosyltransferase family 9 protein n=1 Tax=Fusobacterium ulcerans TaxID=861 RepID=UPI000E489117|nr:glycosyltransferase family 9 protein [Fusobacterium ulcerans]RGY57735.1 lipopolysaccharide heptosyltransferase family protein [Fusobacterium ulcerans]